jgi:hypothetical protein
MQDLRVVKGVIQSLKDFDLNLSNLTVFTEAATGNYCTTPVIAALAGAQVNAIGRSSRFGSFDKTIYETEKLARYFGVIDKINIFEGLDDIDLSICDIMTNTGFLRPITKDIINRLSPSCVIPLMYESWEFRKQDLDIFACRERGIKVYGTNESDHRLRTMSYIGYVALSHLLDFKLTPLSDCRIVILGCNPFTEPSLEVLEMAGYQCEVVNDYSEKIELSSFDAVIFMEHEKDILLYGENGYIEPNDINEGVPLIHICGRIEIPHDRDKLVPSRPAPFGYMSYTADYIDPTAVIDLHTAGLKVAEGLLKASQLKLKGKEYKLFMESGYPARGSLSPLP